MGAKGEFKTYLVYELVFINMHLSSPRAMTVWKALELDKDEKPRAACHRQRLVAAGRAEARETTTSSSITILRRRPMAAERLFEGKPF